MQFFNMTIEINSITLCIMHFVTRGRRTKSVDNLTLSCTILARVQCLDFFVFESQLFLLQHLERKRQSI